jgi:hypothetical protein
MGKKNKKFLDLLRTWVVKYDFVMPNVKSLEFETIFPKTFSIRKRKLFSSFLTLFFLYSLVLSETIL